MRSTCFAVALLVLPAVAEAEGLTGSWAMSASNVSHTKVRHEGVCPSRPRSEPGRTIQIREEGGELSFAMPGGARTTASCWTNNSAVRRRGHSKGPPRWSTRCSTDSNDPRQERGTYTFTLSEDGRTLSTRLVTEYAISVGGDECEGRFVVTRTFRNTHAPEKVVQEPAPDRCRSPGDPAKLELPRRRRVAAGRRVCLPATVRDASGCDLPSPVSFELVEGDAEIDPRGCVQVPSDAEVGDRIRVAAESGALQATTLLEVAREEDADDLGDTSGLRARETVRRDVADSGSAAGGEGAGGVRALQPAQTHGSELLWPILIIAAILLVVLAMVLLLVVRTQHRREDRPDEGPSGQPVASAAGAEGSEGTRVCPTCREEFDADSRFCPHDATRLVESGTEPERPTLGSICPRCHRGYEVGTRRCTVDGAELLPYSIHQIARKTSAGSGESSKICPTCSARYGVDATFCGKDGSELVLVN